MTTTRARVGSAALSRATMGAVFSRAAGMGGAFAMSVAILRSLPRGEAGLTLLIYTLTTAAATLARFGTDTLALREVSRSPERSAPVVTFCAWLTCLLSIPTSLLMAAAVSVQGKGTTPGLVIAAAAVGVMPAALSVVAGSVLRAHSRVASGTFAELGSPVVVTAVGIFALDLVHAASLTSVVWTLTLGNVVTALWSWAMVIRRFEGALRARVALLSLLRTYWVSLGAFCTTALGFFLFSWMPILALGYFGTTHAVGQYNVALYNAGARLAQFVALVPMIQISYLSGRFAKLHHDADLSAISRLSQTAARQAILVAAPFAVALCVFPSRVLGVFGSYADAGMTLRVLAVGSLLLAAIGPVNGLMLTCGHEQMAGRFTFVLLAVSAVTLPILSRYGPTVVAIASITISLSYAVACYVTLLREGIRPARSPLRFRWPASATAAK